MGGLHFRGNKLGLRDNEANQSAKIDPVDGVFRREKETSARRAGKDRLSCRACFCRELDMEMES